MNVIHLRVEKAEGKERGEVKSIFGDSLWVTFPAGEGEVDQEERRVPGVKGYELHSSVDDGPDVVVLTLYATVEIEWPNP